MTMTKLHPGSNHVARVVPLILYASLVYFLYWFTKDSWEELTINPVHFFDDAYMFIRYARIWHLGYGEAWNIGESPVYGNTSQLHFLFVLFLTSFPSLSNDMVIKLASATPAFILMAWLPWFAARHGKLFGTYAPWQRYLLWAGALCPFVYWHTAYDYHWLTGMDTMLSTLLSVLFIDAVLTWRASPRSSWVVLATLLMILLFETRPENLLPCFVFFFLAVGYLQQRWRLAAMMVATVLAFVLVDALFKYHYFGDFVPLAFYSKQTGYLEGFAAGVQNHQLLPLSHYLLYIFPLAALLIADFRRDKLVVMLLFLLPVALILSYFMSMMSIMNMRARYEFPFIFYVLACVIVSFDGKTFSALIRSKKILRVVIILVLGIALYNLKVYSAQIVRAIMQPANACNMDVLKGPVDLDRSRYKGKDAVFVMSDFLNAIPDGTKIVMTEHGYVGASHIGINIIDVVGLHSREVAHHGVQLDWLFGQKPDMIWVPHWNYTCLNHKIFNAPEFWDHYRLYPLLLGWGVALRTDSPLYPVMYQALEAKTKEMYPEYSLDQLEKKRPLVLE